MDLASATDSSVEGSRKASERQSSFSASLRKPSCSSDFATSTTSKALTNRWVTFASNDFARSNRVFRESLAARTPASVACGESFAARRSTSATTPSTNWKASRASLAPTPASAGFSGVPVVLSPAESRSRSASLASALASSPANKSALVCGNSTAPSPTGNPGVFRSTVVSSRSMKRSGSDACAWIHSPTRCAAGSRTAANTTKSHLRSSRFFRRLVTNVSIVSRPGASTPWDTV
mmetsp:Transcript_10941/g.47329  ORF Transcript_10941/g.47329 Transcript_10941/m.47329 type:complete len:235 (-) Transcript_10941:535-1239(-)